MRVIFGGTFDPVHLGHLRMATELREFLGLNSVSLMPCYQAVHKDGVAASAAQRKAMLELALSGDQGLILDPFELNQAAPSYTVNTLMALRASKPNETLVLAMGGDSFAGLATWYHASQLAQLCHIVVIERPGAMTECYDEVAGVLGYERAASSSDLKGSASGRYLPVSLKLLDVSSSDIRQRIALGKSIRYLVPSAVCDYICDNALYLPTGG